MDERVVQFRVGVMVLATLICTVILVLLFSEGGAVLKPHHTVYIHFAEAPGVTEETPIKKSGILIGRVQSVELLEQGGARVTAEIEHDKLHFIRANEVARIRSSLLGDAVIDIVDSGEKNRPRMPIEAGAELPGMAYDDPIQVVAKLQDRLSGAIGSVARTSDELGQVANQVGNLLTGNEQKINRIITQADETSAMLRDTVRNANSLLGDSTMKGKLQEGLEQMPDLIREARGTMARVDSVAVTLDKNLKNLEGFTAAVGDNGEAVFEQLGRSTQKLDALLTQMVRFSENLNSSQGTMSQLLNNPELYQNLNRAAANFEELTRQLRPIVNDARILSDTLARHPEKLGVRGALERSPGNKY